jgi:aquaporin Z
MVATTKNVRSLVAEMFGTNCLVFTGTGAIVINDVSGGAISHVGIALTFGAIVLTLIYALGEISGCHINPAVTLGLWWAGRFEGRRVAPYIVAQGFGALAASATLKLLFPVHPTYGATLPSGSPVQSWVLEFLLTLFLMVVILGVTGASRETRMFAGLAIGSLIGLEAMFGGPISGASMNPARSFAPALVSGKLDTLWIYLTAPTLGALCGVLIASWMLLPSGSGSESDPPAD